MTNTAAPSPSTSSPSLGIAAAALASVAGFWAPLVWVLS